MSAVRFRTCPPPPAVAEAVREMWMLDDDGRFVAGLPKPWVEIVVSLAGVHWWRAAPGTGEHRYTGGWVTPIQHAPRYARAVGARRLIGARLDPWAALALFGRLPPGDGTPPPRLDTLIGRDAQRLRRRLIDAPDDAARFTLFGAWLADQPALAGARTARPAPGPRVRALADSLGIDTRALRRRFARDAGIAPKRWLKLHRLDAVLRSHMLADAAHPLADVALLHGYADQAHMTRDVATLTGTTPLGLRSRDVDAPPHYRAADVDA